MILNLHERWLLHQVGLSRRGWLAYLAVLDPARPDEVDLAAQLGGYRMTKRSVVADLPAWYDQLAGPASRPVRAVAYGRRRYRRQVITAAALHQAGITPLRYGESRSAGRVHLSQLAAEGKS